MPTTEKSNLKSRKIDNYVNGAISGVTSILFTQPLQCIRTTMMVTYKDGKPSGLFYTIKRIFSEEGIRGFYRGLTPTILKNTIGGSLYFGLLENNKNFVRKFNLNDNLKNFLSSAAARGIQCVVINPLIVTSTRFEVIGFNSYKNIFDALWRIRLEEGWTGFFKGLKPFMFKEIPSTAMFFTIYEKLKTLIAPIEFINPKYKISLSSFIAATIVTILNNPLDVIRTRVQYLHFSNNVNHNYHGIIKGVINIFQTEGIRGLTLGIVPRLFRRSISNTIVWTVYESLKLKNK